MEEKQYAFKLPNGNVLKYNYNVIGYVRDFFDGSSACIEYLNKESYDALFYSWIKFNELRSINFYTFLPFFLIDCVIEWRDKIDMIDRTTIAKLRLEQTIPFYVVNSLSYYKKNID